MRSFLLSLWLVLSLVQQRDPLDPRPDVPWLPGDTKGGVNPENHPLHNSLRRELPGYEEGDPFHRRAVAFANSVAADIKSLLLANRSVDQILVKGFADGIPNDGVSYIPEVIPTRCRKDLNSDVLNDEQLAFMRGCVVLELIKERVGEPLSGGALWKTDMYDEKDGGSSGYAYRKVVVEVRLSRRRKDE